MRGDSAQSFDGAGLVPHGTSILDCAHANAVIYGIHPGGANHVFADGSVHLLREVTTK